MSRSFFPSLGFSSFLSVFLLSAAGSSHAAEQPFRRGDVNADRSVDIADAVSTLSFLFGGSFVPPCLKSADVNDSGAVDVADPIYLLGFLFNNGPAPAAPFRGCGTDPTPDNLPCRSFPACEEAPLEEPSVEVLQSDNKRLLVRLRLPEPLLEKIKVEGETFHQLTVPGLEPPEAQGGPADTGSPGVPFLYRLIGVPRGAKPRFRVLEAETETLGGINLYPRQETAFDRDWPPVKDGALPPPEFFMDPPFALNEKIYSTDAFFPPQTALLQLVGQVRDLVLAQVAVASAQHNPVRRELRLLKQLTFEVIFEGGGAFLTTRSLNPFEAPHFAPLVQSAVLNRNAVFEHIIDFPIGTLPPSCVELIIITPPQFLPAAQALRDWKVQKGISTLIAQTGPTSSGGIGTTATHIRSFILDRYNSCYIRPSYVLLLGDAEFIPPFYRSTSGSSTTGTDLDYSLMTGSDLLADLAVARIPVDTLQQAQTVIDKIISYEKSPPLNNSFYKTAAFPAYFQCCRTDMSQQGRTSRAYIETMELIRTPLIDAGYTVKRLYFSDTTYHGTYSGDPTPRWYRNGAALPAAIGPGSGFAWDADKQDVIDAINDGCFLLIHRDHGGQNGWVFPRFRTSDVASLSNGRLLPVLFSVDCATGLFDNETASGDYGTTVSGVYLLESLLRRAQGGVVGALGDTRNSPTWANNALTRGFADAVFPNVLPSYGTSTPIRRLGDILNYGKLYMFSQVGVPQSAGSISTNQASSNNVMWHAFGDPTQEIWRRKPVLLAVGADIVQAAAGIIVKYEHEGAVITALQDGKPVARGVVQDGAARLPFLSEPVPLGELTISASAPDSVSALLQAPEPEPRDLTSEQAFSPKATRLTFEDRKFGERVTTQYAALGVRFQATDRSSYAVVINGNVRGGSTISPDHSLAVLSENNPKTALLILFDPPVRKVGMYIGNGAKGVTATLTAFDRDGKEILTVERRDFPNSVMTFAGIDALTERIARALLDYGAAERTEELDDLLFE